MLALELRVRLVIIALYETASNQQNSGRNLNSFLNAHPIFSYKLHFVPFVGTIILGLENSPWDEQNPHCPMD